MVAGAPAALGAGGVTGSNETGTMRGIGSPQFPAKRLGRVRSIGALAWSVPFAQPAPAVQAMSGWQHAFGMQHSRLDAPVAAGSGRCAARISAVRATPMARRRIEGRMGQV